MMNAGLLLTGTLYLESCNSPLGYDEHARVSCFSSLLEIERLKQASSPWFGMFQKSHFVGEASSLYFGYRLPMGNSPKNTRPAFRVMDFTNSQLGVKQNAKQAVAKRLSVYKVWRGWRHS